MSLVQSVLVISHNFHEISSLKAPLQGRWMSKTFSISMVLLDRWVRFLKKFSLAPSYLTFRCLYYCFIAIFRLFHISRVDGNTPSVTQMLKKYVNRLCLCCGGGSAGLCECISSPQNNLTRKLAQRHSFTRGLSLSYYGASGRPCHT